jgi:hypothetical protein
VTPDSSSFDLAPLCQHATAWWETHVGDLDLDAAEPLALALSRAVAQALLQAALSRGTGRATYEGASRPCSQCGAPARFVSYRSRWLRTLCGDQRVERAYYHCAPCHSGELPWDQEAGLNERIFSPALKALVVECCGRLTHREVEELFQRVLGLPLEESSQQELVEEVGTRLREAEALQIEACFERLEPVPPEAPEDLDGSVPPEPLTRLYVAMDAAKAHIDGAWHDVKCAVLYPGEPPTPPAPSAPSASSPAAPAAPAAWDRAGPKRYVARREEAAMFGRRTYVAAQLAGLERAREVVVLGDGAEWIWNLAAEHFHGATEILDYYHAAEHIWKLVPVLYGEGSSAGKRWAEGRCRELKSHGPAGLLRALKRRKPRSEAAREALRLAQGYFRTHRLRMDYPGFRQRGLMIGSGPVEAACKVIVGQRLKGAGMRWSEPGADHMLAVRTAVLNGQYAKLARYARAA